MDKIVLLSSIPVFLHQIRVLVLYSINMHFLVQYLIDLTQKKIFSSVVKSLYLSLGYVIYGAF